MLPDQRCLSRKCENSTLKQLTKCIFKILKTKTMKNTLLKHVIKLLRAFQKLGVFHELLSLIWKFQIA